MSTSGSKSNEHVAHFLVDIHTQAEVAARLELRGLSVSREIYAQMETGKHHIKVSVLLALKEIFRADFEELFEIGTEL